MKKLVIAIGAAMALGAAACSNPCDKLAKAICDKVKDKDMCDKAKAGAKGADKAKKDKCSEQLKNVDAVVSAMQSAGKLKQLMPALGAPTPPTPVPSPAAPTPPPGAPPVPGR